MSDTETLIALLGDVLAELRALRQGPARAGLTLESCGETLSRADLAALLGLRPRSLEKYVALERKTGQRILPEPIDGIPTRYTRASVRRWLQSESWKLTNARHVLRMPRSA